MKQKLKVKEGRAFLPHSKHLSENAIYRIYQSKIGFTLYLVKNLS